MLWRGGLVVHWPQPQVPQPTRPANEWVRHASLECNTYIYNWRSCPLLGPRCEERRELCHPSSSPSSVWHTPTSCTNLRVNNTMLHASSSEQLFSATAKYSQTPGTRSGPGPLRHELVYELCGLRRFMGWACGGCGLALWLLDSASDRLVNALLLPGAGHAARDGPCGGARAESGTVRAASGY